MSLLIKAVNYSEKDEKLNIINHKIYSSWDFTIIKISYCL